jgi:hypothetical protein
MVKVRELADSEKWFIVNCINGPDMDEAIVQLLDEAGAPYFYT